MTVDRDTTRRSVFGEVVEALMESRGMDVNEMSLTELAEKSVLDPELFKDRVSRDTDEDIGYLNGLAEQLSLCEREKSDLAYAYVFEKRGDLPDEEFRMSFATSRRGNDEAAPPEKLCSVGSATKYPCKLPAEVAVNSDEPDWCIPHAKSYEMKEILFDLETEIHTAMDALHEKTERMTGRAKPEKADRDSA